MKLTKEQCKDSGCGYWIYEGNLESEEALEIDFPVKVTGYISSGGSISAGDYISAGSYISSGSYIRAGSYISSGDSISSGGYISAGGYIRAGDSISSGGYISAGDYIRAGDSISSGGYISADGWEKGKLVSGRMVVGHCKYRVSVDATHIYIGCQKATVEEWDARAAEGWSYGEDKPGTAAYQLIKANYELAKVYQKTVLPLLMAGV
jgi:NDP-sugar pyrophosphorylase family protein